MTGTIFSIEEFSTLDGPGVRTTVFLKGCPLRCQWCHNPEGQDYSAQPLRSPNGCVGCGRCMEAGRRAVGVPCLVEESISVCPKNLIRICGESLAPQDLYERLKPKLWMLNQSGGGITFSGGEPLSQPQFLMDCLQLFAGITHRAVQTSGFAPTSVFSAVLDNCEYVLFDLKQMDTDIHRHYTGVDNTQILTNYRTLAHSGIDFITRIPLIPGVNDTVRNLTATADFIADLGVKSIELLPYNTAAGAKYKGLQRQYCIDFDPTQPPEPHREIFEARDIEVNVL